ncbi:MAG TPA: hypothetical protein VFY75_06375 [Solirubrobacterales bacterium]|nr:hypothetical protein [Solirubrobacterales bacterium]
MKANPSKLVKEHYRTLRDRRTDESRWQDYAWFLIGPAVVYVVACIIGLELPEGASAGLLTASGVLAAFFFGVMLQVAQRALEWSESNPEKGRDTSWQADFLTQIAANAGYAVIVSLIAAAVLVAVLITEGAGLANVLLSALALALCVHLALMLSMVLVRIYALTSDRLLRTKVGGPTGKVTQLHDRKTGSG